MIIMMPMNVKIPVLPIRIRFAGGGSVDIADITDEQLIEFAELMKQQIIIHGRQRRKLRK